MSLPNRNRNDHPLRSERLQRHWSQRELAERVGVTVITVKRWERRVTIPSPYFRLKLTALFGKSEEMLGLRDVQKLSAAPVERTSTDAKDIISVSTATDTSPLWTIPYLRNPFFTGRDDIFALLDTHLAPATSEESNMVWNADLTPPLALTGLGGIGKTQLAVEYAYRAHERGTYTHLFWINATSEEAILKSFISVAALLPACAAADEIEQQKLVDAIKVWLEHCPQRWLLIFDNADDISVLQHYFPRYGNGSLLLTTRAHAVGSLAASIVVEKMGLTEGTTLLLRRARRLQPLSADEVKEIGDLVASLDYFPLALEQAGAYIEETGCAFSTYLHLYQTYRSALLARRGAQATNYPDSVVKTWSLTFQKVAQANPAAAQMLQLFAFVAPDHIPEELLSEGASYWPTLLRQAVENPFSFNQVLEALLNFSLIKRLAEDHLLSLHRLVQVVQLEMIAPEEQKQWAERIVRAVHHLFPRQPKEDIHSWPQCLRYLEQVQACFTLIEQHELQLPEAVNLLDRAGTYLRIHASYALAEAFYQRALRICENHLPAQPLEKVKILNNLGFLYWLQGKFQQVEAFYQRALYIGEEHLGAKQPELAETLHNLGILYYYRSKYQQAETYYLQALHMREKLLGIQHPEVAETLNHLGFLYCRQGKYQQAQAYYQRALRMREELLGAQRPETAEVLHNLGLLYFKQGRYEQAEPYCQRALRLRQELLGEQHPETAMTLSNLSLLYYEQGKYQQAEPYCQQALMIMEKQLGAQHPETAEVLHNLGLLYHEQGKYAQAEDCYQRALMIQEEHLEAQHPETARTLASLAELYRALHQYGQAEPLFARALNIQERTLTANHPDLARTLHDFAHLHLEQGKLQTAATLYQRALTIREQVYGHQHPQTDATRASLQEISHLFCVM